MKAYGCVQTGFAVPITTIDGKGLVTIAFFLATSWEHRHEHLPHSAAATCEPNLRQYDDDTPSTGLSGKGASLVSGCAVTVRRPRSGVRGNWHHRCQSHRLVVDREVQERGDDTRDCCRDPDNGIRAGQVEQIAAKPRPEK